MCDELANTTLAKLAQRDQALERGEHLEPADHPQVRKSRSVQPVN
jgi:hypothetical protein